MAALLVDGFTYREIAQVLGLTTRAVEGRLYRLSKRQEDRPRLTAWCRNNPPG